MQYNRLGSSDLLISAIGLGCMSLGRDQQQNNALLLQASDAGINFFDTADLYDKGWNEETVGEALKSRRKEVLFATKVGNQWRGDGSGWDWNPRKEYILSAADASLRRLQTDYIDLYQLHGGTIDDPIDDTIEAFELLQQAGKIRYYGISSIRPNVIREYVKRSSISSVMMQYSLLDRRPEEECLPLLRQYGIGVLSRGALAQGLLAGKQARVYLGHPEERVKAIADAIARLSGPNHTTGQTALRFVLQQPGIAAAVAGIRTPGQLADALGTIQSRVLDGDQLGELSAVAKALIYADHR